MKRGERLPRDFYARPPAEVAQALLGMRLVRVLAGERLAGRIVEVEAYNGEDDPASHAARGPTPRSQIMYGPPGFAYVYFIYGMHHCLNVVTQDEGQPSAVLIRALEPVEGIERMRRIRWMRLIRGRPDRELTSGPGRLCQALGITRDQNGMDLCDGNVLFIEADEGVPAGEVVVTARIGVRGNEWARTVPWRFTVGQSPFLSR